MTVIGLTTYAESARMLVWHREFAMLHASYLAATERAGGCAVLLPRRWPARGGSTVNGSGKACHE